MNRPPARSNRPDPALGDAGIEALLHTACVKAGAGATLHVGLDRLPLLKPFMPTSLRHAGSSESAEDIQRKLVQAIYHRYGLKPAAWEIEGVMAVAQTQAVMTPLATREGLKALLRTWLPETLARPLMRYTPLEPLVTATVAAVAVTWAAGRYADSVCRLRKAGADWLPAPLAGALNLAPSTLKAWSAEALSMAMPPLKLAAALGRQLSGIPTAMVASASRAATSSRSAATTPRAPATRTSTKRTPAKRAPVKQVPAKRAPAKRAPAKKSAPGGRAPRKRPGA